MTGRKMIAPIVITVGTCLWMVGQTAAFILLFHRLPLWIIIVASIVPLVFVIRMIGVLIERIKEIESGVEDDLDNY